MLSKPSPSAELKISKVVDSSRSEVVSVSDSEFRQNLWPKIVAPDSVVLCFSEMYRSYIPEAGGDVLLMLGAQSTERRYATFSSNYINRTNDCFQDFSS